jgi:hypothetical protein
VNRGIVLLSLLGIMLLAAAELPAQEPAPPLPQSPAPPSARTPAETWAPRHAGELTVEAPFAIQEGPDVLSKAPEKLRDTLLSVKTYKSGGSNQGFLFTVTNITYKPDVPVDIDEAVKDVTTKMSAFVGDQTRKIIVAPTKVSGLDARHAEFHGMAANGRPFYIAFVAVQRGQKLWEVQAMTPNEAAVATLGRVMASVTIELLRK